MKAPEIVGIEPQNWFNSRPLTLKQLRGKIVLLDFWTYSCINCLRTLPALKEMWRKYQDKDVVIIGIHTPEFEFERDLSNVRKAVKKQGLEYPIASDPERFNWDNYGNQYWPRAALISADGEIIMEHVGESGYDEIEQKIIAELKKMGKLNSGTPLHEEKHYHHPEISPEIYAGSSRNEGLGSRQVCTAKGCEEYYDPGKHRRNVIYLQGDWKQYAEYLEFREEKGYILLPYFAREVKVVLSGTGLAEVLWNDKPLGKYAGKDIAMKNNKSYVKIDGSDLYHLIQNEEFQEGIVKIIPFSRMKVYAFTFG
ncbi:redoxin domain-containing protein [Candidatus Woesearchaeota archaeon]|nr:redoxin domain-containing protein [Candidatus Woesearchaeota archaeon]